MSRIIQKLGLAWMVQQFNLTHEFQLRFHQALQNAGVLILVVSTEDRPFKPKLDCKLTINL